MGLTKLARQLEYSIEKVAAGFQQISSIYFRAKIPKFFNCFEKCPTPTEYIIKKPLLFDFGTKKIMAYCVIEGYKHV